MTDFKGKWCAACAAAGRGKLGERGGCELCGGRGYEQGRVFVDDPDDGRTSREPLWRLIK